MAQIKYEHNLNARQFKLYEFLKSQGDNWTLQVDIAKALDEYYSFSDEDLLDFHNAPCRHTITADIRALNNSDYIHKPILSGSKGVKLANKQECNEFISNNIASTVNRLLRLKKMSEKASKNGQCRFVFNGKENPVFEAFIDSLGE